MNSPQFPIYIPTKGRYKYMITSRALTEMGVHHYLIVEPQEVEFYKESILKMNLKCEILELDLSMKEKYELCDNFGLSKSTGSGPARNFAWEHSSSLKAEFHWVMDDNIRSFKRFNKNEKVRVKSSAFFRAMEDFVLRYENVAIAGPNYTFFCVARDKRPAFVLNTKVYSCNLIRNDLPFRWRGRYNEDVILSLDCLKAGWCTIQFNAFLQEKLATQTLRGGNTDELYHVNGELKKPGEKYAKNGTVEKSEMLVKVHPDVARKTWRYNRWHHHVDYKRFKQKLIRKRTITRAEKINNYGMILKIKD